MDLQETALDDRPQTQSLIDLAPVALVIFDEHARIARVNPAAERLFGFSASEIVGQVSPMVPADRRDEFHAYWLRLQAGECFEGIETLRLTRTGEALEVGISAAPVRTGSEPPHRVIAAYTDLTARKRLTRSLAESRRALRRVQRQKDELAALLVHDLKSPLAALLSNLNFAMRSPAVDPDVSEALEDSRLATESLQRMLLDLLDISRSEDGELKPRLEDVDPKALVRRACGAIQRRLEARGQSLTLEEGAGDGTVRLDPELVRRILENLLDNCVKYAGQGGRVAVSVATYPGVVRVTVADSGPGVPVEMRDRIFDKYAQLDRPGDPGSARVSRGLGLTFCRAAARAHGGEILVEDNRPGARFVVTLRAGSTHRLP